MKSLNPKSRLGQSLASSSAALTQEDLPKHPTDAFALASREFEEALHHLFNPYDTKSHGFCQYDQRWHAEVNAPTLFNHKLTNEGDFAPYHISGSIFANGATPSECISDLLEKWNKAEAWQAKIIHLVKTHGKGEA